MYDLLVVDDESIIRRGIRALIDFEGLGIGECLEAENGEEAVKLMESRRIDLILADINMPRMNGLEFCRRGEGGKPHVENGLITGY